VSADAGAIELRGGGAVAVDTETLRHTAGRFEGVGGELEALRDRLGSLELMLFVQRQTAWAAASAASVLGSRIADAVTEAGGIARQLRAAAVVYELVELNAEHGVAFAAGDIEALARIDARRDLILAEHPDAMAQARGLELDRAIMWPAHLVRQATEAGYDLGGVFGPPGGAIGGVALGGLAIGAAAATGIGGWGRIAGDSRLTGPAPPVSLRTVAPAPTSTVAPTSLAAAATRIPHGTASQVRVERYTMADGSKQFAVYVSGMRSGDRDAAEPWDSRSNVELYQGTRSASYEATAAALEAAGAQPGDVVHAFGHSQGAMITAHLALEGGYDTRTLVSFGSPVEADVGAGTLSIAVRHTDDPVAALAGGGHAGGIGAPGSFTAEREAHPATGPADVALPAHSLTGYAETASLVDASPDPRMLPVRDLFGELGGAVRVEVLEFAAARADAS